MRASCFMYPYRPSSASNRGDGYCAQYSPRDKSTPPWIRKEVVIDFKTDKTAVSDLHTCAYRITFSSVRAEG